METHFPAIRLKLCGNCVCVSTKLLHQEIRLNFGNLCSEVDITWKSDKNIVDLGGRCSRVVNLYNSKKKAPKLLNESGCFHASDAETFYQHKNIQRDRRSTRQKIYQPVIRSLVLNYSSTLGTLNEIVYFYNIIRNQR